ncbi:hypothetical protein RJT34_23294 [Clitoria ternatea]|uniref:F-box domain-containing protein n=1 Tax=Clitoria ternatea TaxID=43366 RepID=A0AAN9FUC4_CLITE
MELTEGCIADILSHTTPVDACRLSLVSKSFRFAADSDTVWNRFLPSIISQSSFLPHNFPSKKALYLALADHPLTIHHAKRSFQLEKRSGNKCYMLSARDLSICWGSTDQYWNWISFPHSRFLEVAMLVAVCWFDICGRINTVALSSNTLYAAFLVFKLIDANGFHYDPAVLSVSVGGHNSSKNVCLDPNLEDENLDERFQGLQRPYARSDGWLEIEMGEFFNSGLEEDEVEMRVRETTSNWWKHGFILEGIEVRPKHV